MGLSNIGREFDWCFDCQICVWKRCTGKVRSKFEEKNWCVNEPLQYTNKHAMNSVWNLTYQVTNKCSSIFIIYKPKQDSKYAIIELSTYINDRV